MLTEHARFVARENELSEETVAITDVIAEVILSEVEDILTQQLCLLRIRDTQFARQVNDLQLHDVLLGDIQRALSVTKMSPLSLMLCGS